MSSYIVSLIAAPGGLEPALADALRNAWGGGDLIWLSEGEAAEFARWVGRTHPSDRLRLASFEARAGVALNDLERDATWREAEVCGSGLVAKVASKARGAV